MRNVFFLILAFGLHISAFAQPELINKVVAIVGDQYILLSDVEEQMAVAEERQPGKVPPGFRCGVVEGLLTQSLLVHQAEIDSVKVTEEEIESQLDARITQILDYMGGDVKVFEEYYSQTVEEVKSNFRTDLKNQLLAERKRGEILAGVQITPSEVKKFFKDIPNDSLPYYNAEVELRELVLFPEVNAEERLKAEIKVEEIRQRILKGEDFATLAKKYSEDYGSGKEGGNLGLMRRGKLVPEFEAAAYNLEYNETSEIVETEFGFHIIQTIERKGNSINCRHILIRAEITNADRDKVKRHLDSVRSVILLDTFTFQQAVRKFGDKDWESYNNGGNMVNNATGNTFFETGDLDPNVYFAIDKIKPGDISAPIEFEVGGKKGFRIVQIVSRNPPHKATLAQDYPRIQEAALEFKKNKALNTWVARKASSVYINVDPMYLSCPELATWELKR